MGLAHWLPWLQPSTISTCASSGSPSARLQSSIGTSIGPSLFLCKWSNSTSFSRQSNPTLGQECSSACSWEHVRCWLSVTLARRISSTLGWPREDCFRHHEVHCDDRLVHLPTWLLLRIPS